MCSFLWVDRSLGITELKKLRTFSTRDRAENVNVKVCDFFQDQPQICELIATKQTTSSEIAALNLRAHEFSLGPGPPSPFDVTACLGGWTVTSIGNNYIHDGSFCLLFAGGVYK